MTKTSSSADKVDPIDMSLRLWSEDVALEPLLADFNEQPAIFYVRGFPIPAGRGRIAKRHYASVAIRQIRDGREIEPWIRSLMERIKRSDDLKAHLKSGQVEAVFWIAVLRPGSRTEPHVDERTVEAVVDLGAAIFIEDYVHRIDGNPAKIWLTPEPGKTLAFA